MRSLPVRNMHIYILMPEVYPIDISLVITFTIFMKIQQIADLTMSIAARMPAIPLPICAVLMPLTTRGLSVLALRNPEVCAPVHTVHIMNLSDKEKVLEKHSGTGIITKGCPVYHGTME